MTPPISFTPLFFSSSDPISFSGFRFVGTIAGPVNPITLAFFENSSFTVTDQNYQGQAAPDDAGILTIVPEPSAFAMIAGIISLGFIAGKRRVQFKEHP